MELTRLLWKIGESEGNAFMTGSSLEDSWPPIPRFRRVSQSFFDESSSVANANAQTSQTSDFRWCRRFGTRGKIHQ
jgi:hypothetical protein